VLREPAWRCWRDAFETRSEKEHKIGVCVLTFVLRGPVRGGHAGALQPLATLAWARGHADLKSLRGGRRSSSSAAQ